MKDKISYCAECGKKLTGQKQTIVVCPEKPKCKMKANQLRIVGKFNQGEELSFNDSGNITTPIIKFCENGDIFIKGKLAENDKKVVDAMREFLKNQGLI